MKVIVILDVDQDKLNEMGHDLNSAIRIQHEAVKIVSFTEAPQLEEEAGENADGNV